MLSNSLPYAPLLSLVALLGVVQPANAIPASEADPKPAPSGRIPANGVDYYYEIQGQGEPLLLLHGGMGSMQMFGAVRTELEKTRQVIAVDLHGHGRTALGDRPIEMPAMGDDLAVILKALGYGKVDVLGYSMGADVALRLAIQHPELVRRAVLVSPAFEHDAYYPELLAMQAGVGAGMAESMKPTPMYTSYVAVAPHPEDFPRFLDRIGELMRAPYDWSADVRKVAGPVMLVYGDGDMIKPEHMVKFFQLLGGGLRDAGFMHEHLSPNRLAILPGRTHYDILEAPLLLPTVLPFLDGRAEK